MARTRTPLTWLVPAVAVFALALAGGCNSSTRPVEPACSLDPSALDFGTVNLGDSATLDLTVTNSGSGTLTGTARVLESSEYSVVSGGSYSLAAGQSAKIPIRFKPAGSGHRRCTLDLASSGCGHPVAGVSCCGASVTGCGWAGTPCHSLGRLPR